MFTFLPIDETHANNLLKIKDGDSYAVYDLEHRIIDLDNLMNNPDYDFFVTIDDDDDMIGFIECTFDDEGILTVGCGLLREFMGLGYGYDFVSECMDYLVEYYDYGEDHLMTFLRPSDAKSIKVFERVGFKITDESKEWVELSLDL